MALVRSISIGVLLGVLCCAFGAAPAFGQDEDEGDDFATEPFEGEEDDDFEGDGADDSDIPDEPGDIQPPVPDEPPVGDEVDPGAPVQPDVPEVAGDYPPEALELLPRQVLDAIPKSITAFLRGSDYAALGEACPQQDLEQVMACLGSDEVSALLEKLYERSVISTVLGYMDAEIPNRLDDEDFDALSEHCEDPGEKWATCAFEKGLQHADCSDLEEVLADCLVDNDLVSEYYIAVVADKKAVFGKELYVEFAGLMSILTLDNVKLLREQCPQTDQAEAAECFRNNPLVAEIIGEFYKIAAAITEEAAAEAAQAGNPIDVDEYSEQVLYLFLTIPFSAIVDIAGACVEAHPELETVTSSEIFDQSLACVQQEAQTDAVSNPAYIAKEKLREWLGIARSKVISKLRKKERKAQMASLARILIFLGILAVIGSLIVLLMPVFIGKRYPQHKPLLWKASAIAAGTFALTIVMLGATLLVMRLAQGAIATDSTSPKMRLADAAFDVLEQEEYVEGFSELSKVRLDFIKGPLRTIVEADPDKKAEYSSFIAYVATHWSTILEEPELKSIAKNAKKLKSSAGSFKSVIGFYKKVDWIMGLVPIVLAILAVLLYLLPVRQTLIDIASAPAKAAASGTGQTDIMGTAKHTVFAELKSVLPFLALVLVLLPLTGVFLAIAVKPLIEILLGYFLLTMFYILFSDVSTFVLYASLGGAIMLLVSILAVYIMGMVFFIGTTRKILRSVFHFRHTWGEFKRFFKWGGISMLWILVLPVLFVLGLEYITFEMFEPNVESLGAKDMLLIPVGALVAFPVLFWAARGFKAMKFIMKFPVSMIRHDPALVEVAQDIIGH
jgi:hypothetical protein